MRRSGTLAPEKDGPVGVEWVKGQGRDEENKVVNTRVFSPGVAELAQQLLEFGGDPLAFSGQSRALL